MCVGGGDVITLHPVIQTIVEPDMTLGCVTNQWAYNRMMAVTIDHQHPLKNAKFMGLADQGISSSRKTLKSGTSEPRLDSFRVLKLSDGFNLPDGK